MAQCLFPEQPEKHVGISMARLIGIKWSSGDDPRCLAVCNHFWDRLKERYPDVKATEIPREYHTLFRYLFGNWQPSVEYYPTDDQVIARYRYPVAQYYRDLGRHFDYWLYIKTRWKPVSDYHVKATSLLR